QAAALLDEESKDTESKKRVQEFLVVLAAIIVGIVLLNQCTALSLLQTVPIVVLATAFVVLVGKRQYDELIRMGARFVREALPSKHQEVILLTASGILVSALNQTGTGLTLFESFTEYVSHLPISLPTGIAIAILLLGFAGIPPLATTILVAA